MTEIAATIEALTGDQAARVLALTVDHGSPLPDPAQLRTLDSGLRDALAGDTDLAGYTSPAGQAADPGELARATLLYLAATRSDLVPVITQAVALADDPTREPALFVGALVVLALQTEVKLTRTTEGKWSFTIHKRALRDSTLGQVITKLISAYFPGGS
jgi:hypothetical protein